MDQAASAARRNHVLAALPEAELARLLEHLRPVPLRLGHVLYETGSRVPEVYFPLIGVASLVATLDDGQVVEVATIGNEGMVGLSVFLGAGPPAERASVRLAGDALSMSAEQFRHYVAVLDGGFQSAMRRFIQAMFTQLARNATCGRAHDLRQRCARWLLMTADRMHSDTFDLTQEFLAQMLGVHHASVGEFASALAADGLIRYRRGSVTIVDRDGLRTISCDCYQVVRDAMAAAYE